MAAGTSNTVKERHADDLFKEFKEVSVTEFFRKNKAHLGYSGKVRSLTTIVHELITNSLDACEEAGILPEIFVELKQLGSNHYKFVSRDNGPGIPVKHIADVFGKMLAGTKFHRNVQLRGQQGIGVAGVTMFSQMTTGQPLVIRTCTGDNKVYEVQLLLDVMKNKADIVAEKVFEQAWRGTEIEGEVKNVQFNLGDKGPFEYVKRTAIANPHMKITFIDPEGRKTVFDRVSEVIPEPPKEMKPHPKGMDTDDLLKMAKTSIGRHIGSFLTTSFSRMTNAKVAEIQALVSFDLKKNPRKLTWKETEEIVAAIDKIDFMAPPTDGLSPIGENQVRKALINVLKPEFETVVSRNPTTYSGGVPFQVEVAVAYGGSAGRKVGEETRSEIMRFANRSPLLFDPGECGLTQATQSVEWKRYGFRDFEHAPVTIFVNMVSTYVPYTSAGKQSVSGEEEILKEIRFALMEAGRKFQRYHSKKRRDIEREARLNTLLKYATELAPSVARLTGADDEKLLSKLESLIRRKLKYEVEQEEVDEQLQIEDDTAGDDSTEVGGKEAPLVEEVSEEDEK
ncbi:MAG: DNA topoisomerase VI subunit B [Methanobacteriota archaeon]